MQSAVATPDYPARDCSTIARVALETLTPQKFHEAYRRRGRPVVITNVFDDSVDWTLAFLRGCLGDGKYLARHYGKDQFKKAKREWTRYSEFIDVPFAKYADMLEDRTAHVENVYLAQVDIGKTPAGASIRSAVDELAARTGLGRLAQSDLNIWLGPGGHREPLHFDMGDGTLMQLHGAKRVVLFPPWASRDLYPFPFSKGPIPPWVSQVDVEQPDFRTFPRLGQALEHRRETRLSRGEILYIPAFWWHEVTALGDDYVCSVNRFWRVDPVVRNFGSPRTLVFYLMNKVPWRFVTFLDRWIRKLRE
jgi:hypothetical protein